MTANHEDAAKGVHGMKRYVHDEEYNSMFEDPSGDWVRLSDLPQPRHVDSAGVEPLDIDALAYRFWSIHLNELPKDGTMPEKYKGGLRAWFYATEIRKAIQAATHPQKPAGGMTEEVVDAVIAYRDAVSDLHSLSGYNGILWSEVPLLGPAPEHIRSKSKEKWDALNDTGVALNNALALLGGKEGA